MLGALVGAAGSLLGGLFGQSAAESGARAAIKGAKINAKAALKAGRMNLRYQKMFARSGIQWRAKDAKKAGIHPLAALGAQTTSFAPSFVSGNPGDGHIAAGNILAQGGSDMGQSISRAASAFADMDGRNQQYLMRMQDLQLENMKLQNAAMASQVANLNQPGNPPASPTNRWLIDGQGQTSLPKGSPLVQDQALQRVVSDPSAPWSEPAAVNDLGFSRTKDGYAPVMSKDAKERLEEDWIGGLTWNLRNRVLQNLQFNLTPPYEPPAGKHWKYNPVKQEYQLWDNRFSYKEYARTPANYAADEAYRRRQHWKMNTGL